MDKVSMDRRAFLRGAVIGCSAAASPLWTPITFARAHSDNPLGDNRLVVIVLRGGMDGLGVVRPYGDVDYAGLRGGTRGDVGDAIDLDGHFALHPALAGLMPMWNVGQLGFVHAVSTPYRDKRSHFDGQDMLEAGTSGLGGSAHDGWLNRMLQGVSGVQTETAFAVGRSDMLLTRGAAPVANWSPDAGLYGMSAQAMNLAERVMHDDPLFAQALGEAIDLSDGGPGGPGMAQLPQEGDMMGAMVQNMKTARRRGGHRQIAEFAADRLREDTRIAAFSLNGWDTHANQSRTLAKPLGRLAEVILALRTRMGDAVWGKTTVIAMTEFGRTARMNGSKGTDHGTGGVTVLAGGALRGGRVMGDWPGLAEADLYARRDLMPTRDVRAHVAWAMRGLFGIEKTALETAVFPGLDMGNDPKILL